MKFVVDGTELRGHIDYESDVATFGDSDLGQAVTVAEFIVEEDHTGAIPKVPKEGHEVQIYDDDNTTLLFGGFVRELEELQRAVVRAWRCVCASYAIRAFETATGSLNKAGAIDTDRNFVIAIFRDALKGQSFGVGTGIDDAIITANEAVGWSGVQGTAAVSGSDWSYMTPSAALDLLTKSVPNVSWRIGGDKLLRYGLFRDLAPFAVSTSPTVSGLKAMEQYRERTILTGHRNKMRRGGTGTAEETAVDEVSYARYGKIFEDPYKNDDGVPASDLRRRTYAELRSRRIRRVVSFRVRDKGLEAGQLIDVVNERIGSGTIPAAHPALDLIHARSTSGRIAGERGRFLIQKVTARIEGPQAYAYDVQCGDAYRDLAVELAHIRKQVA